MGETREAAGPSLSTHVLQGALSQAQRLCRRVLICTQAFSGCRDSGEAAPCYSSDSAGKMREEG